MRSSKPRDHMSHCPRCYLRREICICPALPIVKTRTKFLILRHIREAERMGNTGRLAALALPNARIIPCGGGVHSGRSSSVDNELLLLPGTWLMWPDGAGTQPNAPVALPERVVVLDGTWHQARRLYNRTPALQSLPRLVLPAPTQDRDRLRKQHRSDGMSTLEAVAAAVRKLEGAEVAEPLERLYAEVVRRATSMRWGGKPVN